MHFNEKKNTERKKNEAKYFLCFHYLKNVGSKLHVLLAYCSMDHASWCSSVVVSSTNYLKLQRAMRFMCIHQYACCIYWAKLSRIKYAMNWLFRWPCVDFFFQQNSHTCLHTQATQSYTCRKICIRILRLFGKVKQTVFAMWITMVSIPVHHALSRFTCFISTNNACYVKTIRITEEKKIHIIGKNAYNYNYHLIHCTLCIFSTINTQRVEKIAKWNF